MSAQRILFLTHSEQGQSNIHLATALETYSRALPSVEVHLASFAELRPRFEKMSALVAGGDKPPTFHTIEGLTQFAGIDRVGTMRHKPALEFWPKFANIMVPWTKEEYITILDSILATISRVDPHLILTDVMFGQAIDACALLHRPYHVLSPLLASMVCLQNQPFLRLLLTYPLPGTGLPYPLSLKDKLANLVHTASMAYHSLRSTQIRAMDEARRARGVPGAFQGLNCMHVSPERAYITPGAPAADLPFAAPPTLHLCGPICNDFVPLRASDADLAAWLDQAPTLLMIMGTHFAYDPPLARRVLAGLLGGVDARAQILWKVPNLPALGGVFDALLTTARDKARVRAAPWFDAEPAVIVAHANVVGYVHHGGANSYYECARAGKPHVVLPQWADTYYNAVAAEYAGIGVYGNKTCAPDIDATELSVAVKRITSGEEGACFKKRAEEVGIKCREAGGRKRAADIVLNLLKPEPEST
ncbi:glycosyltransferase family 1 protein [Schizophyllum commune H4-8]|uniref:Glycosyltransferase family 1 protein n=1 Tax=Schizophyllum commune (strain H4-8 / FGSC 9210) TaxID=578458 RepID=D8QKB4_SCHCM